MTCSTDGSLGPVLKAQMKELTASAEAYAETTMANFRKVGDSY